MPDAVDILEERVLAAADLIAGLRARVASLERALTTNPAPAAAAPSPEPASPPDPALLDELERLRAERVAVRESIRGLLREIDRVSW